MNEENNNNNGDNDNDNDDSSSEFTQIEIKTNHFPVTFDKDIMISQYDIKFLDEIPEDSIRVRRDIVSKHHQQLRKLFQTYYFDNTTFFATKSNTKEAKEKEEEKAIEFEKIRLNLTKKKSFLELNNETQRQIIHIILRETMQRDLNFIRQGKYYFQNSLTKSSYQNHTQIWKGFHVSVENTVEGHTISVHTRMKPVSQETILDLHKQYHGKIIKNLENRLVITSYNLITYEVIRFCKEKTVDSIMDGKITFREYYKRYTKEELENQNLLECKPKRQNYQKIYLVPQLCFFSGTLSDLLEPEIKKIPKKQTDEEDADVSINALILDLQKKLKDNNYPLQVSAVPVKVLATCLSPPKLIQEKTEIGYGKETYLLGSHYKFLGTSQNKTDLLRCGIICQNYRDGINLFKSLNYNLNQARFQGLLGLPEDCIFTVSPEYGDRPWEEKLHEASEAGLDVVVVILPSRYGHNVYATVNAFSTELDCIITQCVQLKNIGKKIAQQKLLNQIMVKAGFTPWKIDLSKEDKLNPTKISTIIIGMDVCHDRKSKNSVVGFVSTINDTFENVFSQISFQKLGTELVEDIKELIENALINYKKVNNKTPSHIIFFRDGVSESQFELVKKKEIPIVRSVIEEHCNNCLLEFVVVQKRIHTRFDARQQHDVVFDKQIIFPNYWNYYIGLKSNKTPTHYIVLEDDIKLQEEQTEGNVNCLYHLSYSLGRLYFDSIQIVKIPHVIKLADHVAFKYSNPTLLKKIKKENKKTYDVSHSQVINKVKTAFINPENSDNKESSDYDEKKQSREQNQYLPYISYRASRAHRSHRSRSSYYGSPRGSYRGEHRGSYHGGHRGRYHGEHHGSYHGSYHGGHHGSYRGEHRGSYRGESGRGRRVSRHTSHHSNRHGSHHHYRGRRGYGGYHHDDD